MTELSDMFYNPQGFNVLPYKHNYTKTGEYVLTGFFVPAFTFVNRPGIMDDRGVTDTKKAREFLEQQRSTLLYDPKAYLIQCAEFCFTPDEAFALEGDNQLIKYCQLISLHNYVSETVLQQNTVLLSTNLKMVKYLKK